MLSYEELMKKHGHGNAEKITVGPARAPSIPQKAGNNNTGKKTKAAEVKLPATNLFAGMAELPKAGRFPTAAEQAARTAPTVKINLDNAPIKVQTTINPTILPRTDMTKSTSTDEKTRLYQTNDSLLSNDEIFKKYQYVLNDKDMDYATMKRAAKKGMDMAGKMVQRSPDMATYQKATQMQVDLQSKLKSAALTAGLLESMGGTVRDLAVKGISKASPEAGNAMQAQNEAVKAQFRQAQENNPGYYTGGQVSGELAKMAALYSTVGKAAEETALKAAGALGGRMSAATASDFAQKAYALAKYNPKIAAAAKFGTRMLGQQAADTAVLAPLVAAEGISEGKSREEILKELAKQEAIAAGFNIGINSLGALGKFAGKKIKDGKAARRAARTAADFDMETLPAESGVVKLSNPAGNTAAPEAMPPKKKGKVIPDELRQEYADLMNEETFQRKIEEITQTFAGDETRIAAEMAKLGERKQALEELLAIETPKTKAAWKKVQSATLAEAKKLFSLSGREKTEYAKNLIDGAISEAQVGKISQATREKLFEAFFDSGSVSNRELIDHELKQRLKSLKLQVSEMDAANIPDFADWQRRTKGKIGGIAKTDSSNIDTVYQELSGLYPHMFPESITHPAEQLERIAAAAEEQVFRQIPLSGMMDDITKANMRQEFDIVMDGLEESAQKVGAYKRSIAERQTRRLLLEDNANIGYENLSARNIEMLYNRKYELEQAWNQAKKGKLLTAGDEITLKKLLLGEIGEEEARRQAGRNADDLIEVFRAEQPYREIETALKNYKKFTNQRHYDEVADIVGDLPLRDGKAKKGWKDLAPFRYARETQERILDMIAPNRETAERVRAGIFDPIHESERQRTLFMGDYKDRLGRLKLSTKENISIDMPQGKQKMSESGLVQWLGEKRYQMRRLQGESMKRPLSEAGKEQMELLRQEIEAATAAVTPEQLARINEGIKEFQQIYKEIHPKINEVLIRNGYDPIGYIDGYFPHMNFDEPENLLEKAFSKLGFDFASKELPMDIAGRTETFRPGKKWSGNLLVRKGMKTDYDALRAFDLYIDNISDVIYHTDNIKRLRAYEDYFRYNLSEKGIQEKIKAIRNDASLSDFEREGRIAELYEENAKNHKLQNYVSNIRIYTDTELAGKKHISDRGAEQSYFGRKFYKRINTLGNRVSANMVAGNIASAITNIIPITQAAGSIGVKNGVRGLQSAMEAFAEGAGKDALTRKSAFLTTRRGLDMLYETGLQKVSKKAGALMEIMDSFSTQVVWRGRYFDNVAKGLDEETAIKEADRFCRGLFAGRSKGSMPTMFMSKHPLTKALSAFQLEVNNQISFFLKDVPRNAQGSARKMAKAYCGAIIMGHIYNDFYEKLTGRRSALDPLDYANKFIGDMTGTQGRNVIDIVKDAADGEGLRLTEKTAKRVQAEKEGEDFKPIPSDAIGNLTKNIGGQVPFVGGLLFDGGRVPIQSAFINPKEVLGTVADASNGTITKEQRNEILRRQFGGALAYAALPFGGAQIKKSIGGLETMAKGGSYKQRKEGASLQFAVDQENPLNWIQAGAFGKWALPEGQKYFDGGKALDPKRTKTYEALVKGGVKNTSAYQIVSNIQSKEKGADKRAAIRWTALPKEQQAILYYDLAAGDEDKALMDYFNMRAKSGKGKVEDIGEVYDCLSRMAEHGNSVPPKRNIIREINLSDEDKKHIYLTRVSNSVAKESACISKLEKHGIGINAYLSIKNKYGTLNSQKGIDQTAEFNRWLREQGFSWEQQKAIKEEFMFWGMYPKK
ncbi:MAG: hypothetical protein HFE61_10015 [Anaerotignum sp.]|nr:hypothetical protein [Anaerotignum sp.]